MNKTALEELIEWIDYSSSPIDCIYKAKQLLEKERQQILQALMFERENFDEKSAEDYYKNNYTFKGQYEKINTKING